MTRFWKTALLTAAFVVTGAVSPQAQGQVQAQGMSVCLPHDDAVAKLKKSYGEEKIGLGLGQRGASVVELFVSETGTWTVLVTRTNGMSCVAASGDNWSSSPILVGDAI